VPDCVLLSILFFTSGFEVRQAESKNRNENKIVSL